MNQYQNFQPERKVTQQEARALSIIARKTAKLAVSLNESDTWHVSLQPAKYAQQLAELNYAVTLRWNDAVFILHISKEAIDKWLYVSIPEAAILNLPDPLCETALSILIQQVINQAGIPETSPVQITGITPPEQQPTLVHKWIINLNGSVSNSAVCLLSTSADGLLALANACTTLPTYTGHIDLTHINTNIKCLIGTTSLPARKLTSLAAGDVVLLDQNYINQHGELWLRISSSTGIRIKCNKDHYVVVQGWSRIMTESNNNLSDQELYDHNQLAQEAIEEPDTQHMQPDTTTDNNYVQENNGSLQMLDDINICLGFDLGDRHMPIAELQALQPGEIFNLERPINDGPVFIRANGSLIGYGELIDIDGKVGVLISQLGSKK